MKTLLASILVTLALSACSTNTERSSEAEAVRDYISAAGIPEVSQVRTQTRDYINHRYVNEYFVLLPMRAGNYLAEFSRKCYALRERGMTAEMHDDSYDTNTIRAGYDNIRGCRIGALYELTDEQVQELKSLGDAPGNNIFMPDKDDEE